MWNDLIFFENEKRLSLTLKSNASDKKVKKRLRQVADEINAQLFPDE